MAKGTQLETNFLQSVFNGTAFPADDPLFIALHTADPTESGAQNSSELSYANYARQSVPATGAGWTVAGDTASNAAEILFPASGNDPSQTATHFSIGNALSGPGKLLYHGALTAGLAIQIGTEPKFPIGNLVVTED